MENSLPLTQPSRTAEANGGAAAEPELSGEDPFASLLVNIEGIAVQYGLLPIDLPRVGCSAPAETLLRKLGRSARTDAPWLPVATLGPLLVLAHHNPKSSDTWGIPDFLTVKVVISAKQYEVVRRELVMRLQMRPLEATSPFEGLARPNLKEGDVRAAFDWLMASSYPIEPRVKDQLVHAHEEMLAENESPGVIDYNNMQEHLGIALHKIASQSPVLVYNPDEAPRQDMFPTSLLEKHCVYPLYLGQQCVYLMTEVDDIYAFEDEWLSLGNEPIKIVTVQADVKSIRKTISKHCGAANGIELEFDTSEYELSDDANLVEIIPEDIFAIDPQNVNHTPEEMIKWVLYQAIQARASDLHLEKYYNMVRFRARVDGGLRMIYAASEELMPRFIALVKNYANLGQSRQEAQDGRFGMAIGKRRIDVRVAAVPCRGEFQKVIMRFLDKDGGLKSLTDLNLSQRQSTMFEETMGRDQGLVLVTGPTGSGKTTTLYALLNSVNDDDINIHTIEDPIEYRLEGINQTQTDPVHGISFLTGLRALLRSDPDVILIGECRDEETANAAVTSALTGHLVLTTLHANDSLRAISRLLSMGVPNHLLGDSLVLSQAQRLVRRLCNYCKRPVEITPDVLEMMRKNGVIGNEVQKGAIYTKVGCSECHNTGYKGRVALMEICEVTAEMKDLISEGAPIREVRQVAHRNGLLSLYQEGLSQVLAGETTIEEIRCLAYMTAV